MRLGPGLLYEGRTLQGARPKLADFCSATMAEFYSAVDISVAAELAKSSKVLLIEAESQPAYHTTGRSAAVFSPVYGPEPIRALTRASERFFLAPPKGFCDAPLLSPLHSTFIARADQIGSLEAMATSLADATSVERIDAQELQRRIPLLRKGYAAGALWDSATCEIDVAALHQGYLRLFRSAGGVVETSARVRELEHHPKGWRIETEKGAFTAGTIVNAAGAWADEIGALAGAEQIDLVPKRRTALIIDPPEGYDPHGLPLVIDVEEGFYLKPDAGKLLISPANEDPEPPCDVQPDELDIAIGVHNIEQAFDVQVKRIQTPWAGLRSFVADKSPVAGVSQLAKGFYWLAGQGGYGIQSAPALAEYAAAEILGRPLPGHVLAEGLDPASLRPARLGRAA